MGRNCNYYRRPRNRNYPSATRMREFIFLWPSMIGINSSKALGLPPKHCIVTAMVKVHMRITDIKRRPVWRLRHLLTWRTSQQSIIPQWHRRRNHHNSSSNFNTINYATKWGQPIHFFSCSSSRRTAAKLKQPHKWQHLPLCCRSYSISSYVKNRCRISKACFQRRRFITRMILRYRAVTLLRRSPFCHSALSWIIIIKIKTKIVMSSKTTTLRIILVMTQRTFFCLTMCPMKAVTKLRI